MTTWDDKLDDRFYPLEDEDSGGPARGRLPIESDLVRLNLTQMQLITKLSQEAQVFWNEADQRLRTIAQLLEDWRERVHRLVNPADGTANAKEAT